MTQDLCAVCAVSSGQLASACPVDVPVLSLDPRTLGEVAASVRTLAARLGVAARGDELAAQMLATVEQVAASVRGRRRRRVFFAEWIDPPFCAGHWLPEMIALAGGEDVLGRAGVPSHPTTWDEALALEPELVIVGPCGFGAEEAARRAGGLALAVRGGGGRRGLLLLAPGAAARGRRPPARASAAPRGRPGPRPAGDPADRRRRRARPSASLAVSDPG